MAGRAAARLAEPDSDGVRAIEGLTPAEAQEAEADGEFVTLPVGSIKVRVRPQKDWRMSDLRALNKGDLDAWADAVIHPDDLDDFFDQDITMREFQAFAEEAASETGDDLGKSRRPRTSRKSTRKS